MAKEDDFSMFDDPSFSDFTEEDWKERKALLPV